MTTRTITCLLAAFMPWMSSGQTGREIQERLDLKVALDRDTYTLDEAIRVDIRVSNVSRKPVRMFHTLGIGQAPQLAPIFLVAVDNQDRLVGPSLIQHTYVPFEIDRKAHLITLEPHHYLGRTVGYQVKDLVKEPGRYMLKIRFVSVLKDDWGDESVLTTLPGDLVTSAPFEVLPD